MWASAAGGVGRRHEFEERTVLQTMQREGCLVLLPRKCLTRYLHLLCFVASARLC